MPASLPPSGLDLGAETLRKIAACNHSPRFSGYLRAASGESLREPQGVDPRSDKRRNYSA